MKKIYLILVLAYETSLATIEKIQGLGEIFKLYDSYIVFTNLESSEELYSHIVDEDNNSEEIVIFELPLDTNSYFGYADRDLWDWLSEKIDAVNNSTGEIDNKP